MADMLNARRVMVDNQIRTFDVTDRDVLQAFDTVPREHFVSGNDRAIAYSDNMIAVGHGTARRALLMPLVLARLIQALEPEVGERALDVMSGSGYPAAIFAAMGLDASFIESDAGLTDIARAAFGAAGMMVDILPPQDITAKAGARIPGPGFDVILVNGATEVEPDGFFSLLREGGRLGIIRREGRIARALVYVKANGVVGSRRIIDAEAPVLPGFVAAPGFVF